MASARIRLVDLASKRKLRKLAGHAVRAASPATVCGLAGRSEPRMAYHVVTCILIA